MPNYIKNVLIATGNDNKRIGELFGYLMDIRNDDNGNPCIIPIDFNRIVPMPQSIADTTEGSRTDLYYDMYKKYMDCGLEFSEALVTRLLIAFPSLCEMLSGMGTEERNQFLKNALNDGKRQYENAQKYGCRTWYKWAICNWETKWNAMNSVRITPNAVSFETAWSGVPNLMSKVSERFPGMPLVYAYADEDMGGSNCGLFVMTGEDIVHVPVSDSEHFMGKVWDEDTAYILKAASNFLNKVSVSEESSADGINTSVDVYLHTSYIGDPYIGLAHIIINCSSMPTEDAIKEMLIKKMLSTVSRMISPLGEPDNYEIMKKDEWESVSKCNKSHVFNATFTDDMSLLLKEEV